MKKSALLITLFFMTSCSMTQDMVNDYSHTQCQENEIVAHAYDKGKKGDQEEKILHYFRQCQKDYQVEYKENKVIRSYKDGLKKYCHKSTWELAGKKLGEEGKEYDSLLGKIKVCQIQNLSSAESGLKRGHKEGLRKYCNRDLWEKKGFDLGLKSDKLETYNSEIKICLLYQLSSAKTGLERGYKKGIRHFCETVNWHDSAMAKVLRGESINTILEKADKCLIYEKMKYIMPLIKQGYQKGQESYCTVENAQKAGRDALPFNFTNCPVEKQQMLKESFQSQAK